MEQRCYINELPEEILCKILSLVNVCDLLKNGNVVCKKWHSVIQSPTFWRDVKVDVHVLGSIRDSIFSNFLVQYPAFYAVNITVDDTESLQNLQALGEKKVKELYVTIGVEPYTPLFSSFHDSVYVPVKVTQKLRVHHRYSNCWKKDSFTTNLLKANCNMLSTIDIRMSMWGALTPDISESLSSCQYVTNLRIPAKSVIVAFSLPRLSHLTLDLDFSINCNEMRADLGGKDALCDLKSLTLDGEFCPDDNSGFLTLLSTYCKTVKHVKIIGDCWEPESLLAFVQNCTSVNIASDAFTKELFDGLMSSKVTIINGSAFLTLAELESVKQLVDSSPTSKVKHSQTHV